MFTKTWRLSALWAGDVRTRENSSGQDMEKEKWNVVVSTLVCGSIRQHLVCTTDRGRTRYCTVKPFVSSAAQFRTVAHWMERLKATAAVRSYLRWEFKSQMMGIETSGVALTPRNTIEKRCYSNSTNISQWDSVQAISDSVNNGQLCVSTI